MNLPEHITTGFDFDEAIALAELCQRAHQLFGQETGVKPEALYDALYPAQPWRFVHTIGEAAAPTRVLIVQRAERQQYGVIFWTQPTIQPTAPPSDSQHGQAATKAQMIPITNGGDADKAANDNTQIHQAGSAAYPPLAGEITPPPVGVRVYGEWLAAVTACQNMIEQFFAGQMSSRAPQAPRVGTNEVEIYLTGYGAGGCLAALCALYLKRKWESRLDFPFFSLKMINFGSPKLGNKAFADYYHKHMKGFSYRVQNLLDGVTFEPTSEVPFPYNLQLLLPSVDYVRNGDEYYMTYEHIGEPYILAGIGNSPAEFHFRSPISPLVLLPFAHSVAGYKQSLLEMRRLQETYWKPVQRFADRFEKQRKQLVDAFQKQGTEVQKVMEEVQIKVTK